MSPLSLFLGVIQPSGLLKKLHGPPPPGKLVDISHQFHKFEQGPVDKAMWSHTFQTNRNVGAPFGKLS